jgi:hypothetical protein
MDDEPDSDDAAFHNSSTSCPGPGNVLLSEQAGQACGHEKTCMLSDTLQYISAYLVYHEGQVAEHVVEG